MTLRAATLLTLLLAPAAFTAVPEEEIAAQEAQFSAALEARDAKLLEPLLADPFTWIHSSYGRVDDRVTWLASAARGMALSGQRMARSEHGATLQFYGEPAHLVVRISRVRMADAKRESWIRQTHTWVRNSAGKLRFTLDERGELRSVAMVRDGREVWRATRRVPAAGSR